MGISSMDFHTRVQRGKTVEERIKDVLRANGFQVTDPTSAEDMYQKIDCFLDGQAAQIKYRDSGDDILYELIKPHDLGMSLQQNMKLNPGRDFRGKAAYYVVLTRDGRKIYIIPVQHIKVVLMQAAKEYGNQALERPFKSSAGIEFKPLTDPADRRITKVNAFIPPAVFAGIAQVVDVPRAT